MRKASQAGIDLVKHFEGCRLSAYQDARGIWTIGYGHTAGVRKGNKCTQAQADKWLAEDLAAACAVVEDRVTVPITQNQLDALASFVFNVGAYAFLTSTLRKKLNAKDVTGAAAEFDRWTHVRSQQPAGLIARRKAERELFETTVK